RSTHAVVSALVERPGYGITPSRSVDGCDQVAHQSGWGGAHRGGRGRLSTQRFRARVSAAFATLATFVEGMHRAALSKIARVIVAAPAISTRPHGAQLPTAPPRLPHVSTVGARRERLHDRSRVEPRRRHLRSRYAADPV